MDLYVGLYTGLEGLSVFMRYFLMFVKKIFVLLAVFLVLGCAKEIKTIWIPDVETSKEDAIHTIEEVVKKKENIPGYEYINSLHSRDARHYAFIWKSKKQDDYFYHKWDVYGSANTVIITKNGEKESYQVELVSDKIYYDCYGYSYKYPKLAEDFIKIYWSLLKDYDCLQNIVYEFDVKEDAYNFASALYTLFTDLNFYEEKYQMDTTSTAETDTNEAINMGGGNTAITPDIKNKCSVDKILKMISIGLSKEEIQKVCE